jgi:hypothetical protein
MRDHEAEERRGRGLNDLVDLVAKRVVDDLIFDRRSVPSSIGARRYEVLSGLAIGWMPTRRHCVQAKGTRKRNALQAFGPTD